MNSDDCGCAYQTDEDKARGAASIAYTNEVVADDVRAYLRGLSRQIRLTYDGTPRAGNAPFDVLFVHGSPRRINEYLFDDRPDASLLRMMETAGADVMAFGHTHRPFHKLLRYEADPEACRVEFVRVVYDVERATTAIHESPLPDAFAEMLRAGR